MIACAALSVGMYLAVAGLLFGHTVNLPVSSRIWAMSGSSCFVLISAAIAFHFRHPAAWLMTEPFPWSTSAEGSAS